MSNEIKIYVADLAAYNNGILHGVWIDATQEIEDIQAQVNAMLAASPIDGAEEYAIHGHEGFDGYNVEEYEGLEALHEIVLFIEEHPVIGGKLIDHCGSLEEAKVAMENYAGMHESLADYAQELTEETTQIPENLRYYIDYDGMARDMLLGGDVFTIETGYKEVHIFWNH